MGLRGYLVVVGLWIMAVAMTANAGGSKRTAEKCVDDGECDRGHCHTKEDGDKVCVDCSSSKISDTRRDIKAFCKDSQSYPRKCDVIPGKFEAAEQFFKIRIENGDKCVAVRKDENSSCWNGGNQGHRDAVDEAERGRANCYSELGTRQGNGGIYTCSDSTYVSEASDADGYCGSYGNACNEWSKNDSPVSCGDIESAMQKTDKCVRAVEKLDSDCLPRLSSWRESQFGKAKKAYDACKEVLDYKKDKKLCK